MDSVHFPRFCVRFSVLFSHLLRRCIIYYFYISILLPAHALSQWSEDSRESGCVLYRAPKRVQVVPMRAVCIWSTSPAALRSVISRPQHYDSCFSRVERSELISTSSRKNTTAGRLIRVYQIHNASPASDRAAYIDYREDRLRRGWRLYFRKSPPEQVPSIDDFVEVRQNQGYWHVEPHPRGAKVIFEGAYDPGGSVPSFLVNWFLSNGVQKMMDELLACAQRPRRDR